MRRSNKAAMHAAAALCLAGRFLTPDAKIEGTSFAQSSGLVSGFIFSNSAAFAIPGQLAITAATVVPESSTWAMMLLGFSGLGFFACRRNKKLAGAAVA